MEPVQSLISSTVALLVRPAPLSPEKVLFAWRASVGPAVSRVTRVRLAGAGVLEVVVDDDRFGDELARSAPVVLSRVQALLGPDTVGRLELKRPERSTGRRRRAAGDAPMRKPKGAR
jgi:predicted nucleic acid-binding Zn ribbon protein